ncbi:MAG: DUF2088 domain-containing protein [Candidatus Latescibacteria bacterium]|jgi:lactate racemase|nr:DUF2088 domain-containing protein [Candidatus Latescibacterota bacterium]
MKYFTYSGNNLINANLPDDATILYPRPAVAGISKGDIPAHVKQAFDNPLDMPPLREMVDSSSRILIAFDDNCQPFPATAQPDIRQIMIGALLEILDAAGVKKENIQLMCAVALHRKMRPAELATMLGKKIMSEFHPHQLGNFDAEDPDDIVLVGETSEGEPVETTRKAIESDLVIYVDSIQIPLNGGHKSVAVGLGTYNSIAPHHAPQMTQEKPHVMQPEGSDMHSCIERISRVILEHTKIMVLEATMNNATYAPFMSYMSKPNDQCNFLEKSIKTMTPLSLKLVPEPLRFKIFKNMRSDYSPININAGSIDAVHEPTLAALRDQLLVTADRQFDTMVFGLPDLSPYSIDARINPVLVLSDVLGYVFNWFYNKPFVKPGGVVIIMNPVFEIFHPEYHVAYEKFWNEVLPETHDPYEMQSVFQDKFARDPHLIDCYRNRYAHHGFHPFTVWYWATYPLKYLSRVILVGPKNDSSAKRLGVAWAPDLDHALGQAKEASGGSDVVALTIPPFMYMQVND